MSNIHPGSNGGPTKIELDRDDCAIIIKSNGELKSITPASVKNFISGPAYIAIITIFFLQNIHLFKRVEKVFLKKAKKSGKIPVQVNADSNADQVDKNQNHHSSGM